MSVTSIDRQYTQSWIYGDIEREIRLAREGSGGGNLLAALGLLCYTEYIGGLMHDADFSTEKGARNFNTAFREMGKPYVRMMQHCQGKVYDIFRGGLVHQYNPKENCEISMLRGDATAGVGELPRRALLLQR